MYKVTTLKGYGKVPMELTRISEIKGWALLQAEGGLFDTTTADLVDDLSLATTDYEVVKAHTFETGDRVLIPQARGWLLGTVH